MSMNYFKKLESWMPDELAHQIERRSCVNRGIIKNISDKLVCYSNALVLSEKCIIKGRFNEDHYCTDFLAQGNGYDNMYITHMLAKFMVEHLSGDDKINYLRDYEKFWQERIASEYKKIKSEVEGSVSSLKSIVTKSISSTER